MAVICQSKATWYEVHILAKDSLNIQYIRQFPFSRSFTDTTRIATHLVKHFSSKGAALGLCPFCGGSQSSRSSICLHLYTLSALSCLPVHRKHNTATLNCTVHDRYKQVATPSTWGCQNTMQQPHPFSLDMTATMDTASTGQHWPSEEEEMCAPLEKLRFLFGLSLERYKHNQGSEAWSLLTKRFVTQLLFQLIHQY